MKQKPDSVYTVYILRTSSNTLYIGQTNNLTRRLKNHQEKKRGAKYLAYYDSFELVYQENYPTRSKALRREIELKKWPRNKKERLISSVL